MNQQEDVTLELLSAYLDGELTRDEQARVEQLLGSSQAHRQLLVEMQAVQRAVQGLPAERLDAGFADRVLSCALSQRLVAAEPMLASDPRRSPRGRIRPEGSRWPGRGLVGAGLAAALLLVGGLAASWYLRPARPHQNSSQLALADRAGSPPARSPERGFDADTSVSEAGGEEPADTVAASQGGASVASEPASDSLAVAAGGQMAPAPTATPSDPGKSAEGLAGPPPLDGATGLVTPTPDPSARPSHTPPPPTKSAPSAPRVPVVPHLDGTQQMLLVIDVTLTSLGTRQAAFDQAMIASGISFDCAVPVDAELEKSLLESRFFDRPDPPPASVSSNSPADERMVAVVYVVALAGQVDDMWRHMKGDAGRFADVSMDIALRPGDLSMFDELRQAVDEQAGLAAAAAEQTRRRRAAAHRLVFSPGWRGTPVRKLDGVDAMAGLLPDWMLGKPSDLDTGSRPPDRPVLEVGRAPELAEPRLGEEATAEALFVVRPDGQGGAKE